MGNVSKIGFDDIREGDVIRIVDIREVTVSKAGLGEYVEDHHGLAFGREALARETRRQFQLLERPIPPLPEKPGSMISIPAWGLPHGTERWVLVEESTKNWRHVWINVANGSRLSPSFIRSRVAERGGFEVVS